MAQVPKISDRSRKLAEIHKKRQKLFTNEQFMKRMYDKEQETYVLKLNPTYDMQKS